MTSRLEPDEIWHWVKVIDRFQKSGLTRTKFCKKHKINYQRFTVITRNITFNSENDLNVYQQNLKMYDDYLNSKLSPFQYCLNKGIRQRNLLDIGTHLNYIDVIERLKIEKANVTDTEEELDTHENNQQSQMKFIAVPNLFNSNYQPEKEMMTVSEPQVIKAQNEIELSIASGIKVIVSSEVATEKLIKIIQLLKDL